MPHRKKTTKKKMSKKRSNNQKSLSKAGFKKASNKTTKFTYYYNPKTTKVFKDTDKDGKIG